jgi:hypothetical protein
VLPGDEVTIVFADDAASAAELAGFLLNRDAGGAGPGRRAG